VVSEAVVAVPGDLATATGGFAYDRRIIGELSALGWKIEVLNLGGGFPQPTMQMRAAALKQLAAIPSRTPVVIDGLAFGALPEAAERLRQSHRLVALVHHPLALETGLTAEQSAHLRAGEQTALACARHVIATSPATVRILAADYGVSSERLSVVEPGTDKPQDVSPRVKRRPFPRRGEMSQAPLLSNSLRSSQPGRAPEGTVALLSVGAVVPRKGYDVLVAALAKIRHLPWELVIVGDCSRSPRTVSELRAEITRQGLNERVILRGVVTDHELASLYVSSDLFVLPSRFEGYGMAFTEAIVHGLPVVCTSAGALRETVPRNASVWVPVDDADALAEALRRLIQDPHARKRLAADARAATFPSWREQGALFARILEALP
jgi:glycosyltransferase involved in cell wall biosynthesis